MTQRIKDKKKEIEKYLQELKIVKPESLEEYKGDLTRRLSCERVFEKITEAITDLAFIVIKYKKLDTPNDDKHVFDMLEEKEIIPEVLATSLKEARGMRNILAHQYGNVDNEIVYEAITKEIEKDTREFLELIE